MESKYSRIGLLISLGIHSSIALALLATFTAQVSEQPAEEITSISMEMLAARLEQPQVAVAAEEPTPEPEPKVEPEAKEEPEEKTLPEPVIPKKEEKPKEKIKPKEKPKEKLKPKPVEKPKEPPKEKLIKPKEKTVSKALEKGTEEKQGIVAKAIPNATPSIKAQTGVPNGSPTSKVTTGSTNSTASPAASSNEIAAFKVTLQRALQRQAANAYPTREKMMRKTGVVTISFSVTSSGQLTNVQVTNSSGNSNLDAAAVKAAQRTKVSPPPVGFPAQLTVPVRFLLE